MRIFIRLGIYTLLHDIRWCPNIRFCRKSTYQEHILPEKLAPLLSANRRSVNTIFKAFGMTRQGIGFKFPGLLVYRVHSGLSNHFFLIYTAAYINILNTLFLRTFGNGRRGLSRIPVNLTTSATSAHSCNLFICDSLAVAETLSSWDGKKGKSNQSLLQIIFADYR